MVELNLLKYLKLNFAEIHQFEHEIIKVDETKKTGKKFPVFLLTAIIGLLILIGIGVSTYMFVLSPNNNKQVKKVKKATKKVSLIENDKFKKIGSIKVLDKKPNTNTNTNTNTNEKPVKIKKQVIKKKTDIKPKTQKIIVESTLKEKKPVKKIIPVTYNIICKDIRTSEYKRIKKYAKSKKLKINIIKTHSTHHKIWVVFKPDHRGKKTLLDKKVKYITSFKTQNNAIKYAKKKNIPAIIVSKNLIKKYYNIKILGFKTEKDVKNFINIFHLSKKSVKIIKNMS